MLLGPSNIRLGAVEEAQVEEAVGFFYFFIFQNRFLHKYIFGFIIYRFIPLPPGCGAAGPLPPSPPAALLPGGRDLNINKIYF